MKQMQDLIAVNENTEGIIGKFFYYSTSNILIDRGKFQEIGQAFGLPKFKPAKESKSGAYRNATTAIKDRVVVKNAFGTHTYRIYCRDNKRETDTCIVRELVKETLGSRTNDYDKLANIIFDKETETVYTENVVYDADVNVEQYCRQAQELYEQFCTCYSTEQVDAVIQDQLQRMQANKISIHGNLYFIPSPHLSSLNTLEDYIESISGYNLNNGFVMSNSMYVVDDERQRQKMTEEFYVNYKREIEDYQAAVQRFIDNGCTSKPVINRWIQKIQALQEKKATYEEILKRRLSDLDSNYQMLKMQFDELQIRSTQGQGPSGQICPGQMQMSPAA